jgi:hypothetical protein
MPDTATVISEILAGDALTLSAAARKLVPHRGRGVAPSTLWRWYAQGIRTPDGRRVHLEMARVGGKWLTSQAALARFIGASTPAIPTDTAPAPSPRTARQRAGAAERAGRTLEAEYGFQPARGRA